MNKLKLPLFLFILFSKFGFSQNQTCWKNYPNMGILHYTVILENDATCANNYKNIQFEPGKLVTKNKLELNSIKIRYNVAFDEMECKIGSQHSKIKSPQKLKEIDINGDCFEYRKYLVKKDTTSGYLYKLFDGSKSVYAKYFLDSDDDKTSVSKIKSYYLVKNKGELPKKIYSVKNMISRSFSNLMKQANEFEQVNHLNLNNPKDLKKLLTYLDHLSNDNVASR